MALPSRKEITLDLCRTDSFDFTCSREIEVSPGDKVLIRSNDKRLGLINGQLLTISSIAPNGTLNTGRRYVFPRVSTTATDMSLHKVQGWTADPPKELFFDPPEEFRLF